MSFTIIEPAPARLNRSELAVPGSNPKLFEKAAASAADVIFLDLEDAVAPDDKVQARKNIIKALNTIDWGSKTMSVRINGLDTHYMYRDVVDIIEQGGDRLDLIMIPKVGTAADVYAVDMLVTQVEDAVGRKKRIGFEMIIETAPLPSFWACFMALRMRLALSTSALEGLLTSLASAIWLGWIAHLPSQPSTAARFA